MLQVQGVRDHSTCPKMRVESVSAEIIIDLNLAGRYSERAKRSCP